MKVHRHFGSVGHVVIGLAAGFFAVASPGSTLAQSGIVKQSQLTRYTVPTTTWVTPIVRGFQWVYSPETFEKTLPLFAYKLSQIYFDQKSVCRSLGIGGYSQYDAGTAALVYKGQEYDGFPLGSSVDTKTLETLGKKVAMSRVLTKREFTIGTDFQDVKKTIDDFVVGLENSGTKPNVVSNASNFYNSTWIPSSPSARSLMIQMIAKAERSPKVFNTVSELSRYWHEEANDAVQELDVETNRSTKMLQFVVNAVKTKEKMPKTSKLTLTQLCESSRFIASRRQALGDSLLLATKRPLPKIEPYTFLTGPQSLRVVMPSQSEASRLIDAQGKN